MTEEALDDIALGHAFEASLKRIPTKALEDFASRKHLLGGGYRPGNPTHLCNLVTNALRPKLRTYDKELGLLLRRYVPEADLLSQLSQEALEARRRALMVTLGKAPFVFFLLLDPREEVRSLASQWMTESGAEMPEAEAAQKELHRLFASVTNPGESGGKASSRTAETLNDLRNQLQEQEKAARKDRRALEEATQAKLREMKSTLATAQFNIDERQKQIDQLQATLQRERRERDQRVAELLSERQIRLFQGWLKPAVALEAEATSSAEASLLERAEQALQIQAKQDRASAAHTAVRAQLDAVSAMLQRVEGTLASALVQSPELVAVRNDLLSEQTRLTILLEGPRTSPIADEMLKRIHVASQADYEPLVTLLRQAIALNLISSQEERALAQAFHHRAATWGLSKGHTDKDAEALAELLSESEQAIERRNPQLTKALRGEAPALIFLDGHNILNGLGRYKQRRGEARTHELARAQLQKDIALFFRDLPFVGVHLVWDGETRSDFTISDNAIGHYSGGTGEHRADHYILDQLDFFRKQPDPLPLIVVTDDNGFGGEAIKRTAAICKLHDFEAFLNAAVH